ncbi:MAG: ExeA family protein [Gammaproteobacteria bacterium]
MYEQHFGFTKPPFRITPDPAFFFPGGNRGAVLEALVYAVSRGEGIVKVVGEVGSGKTMLCRMLERELPEDCEIVYLANPGLSAEEILHAIALDLGLDVAAADSRVRVLGALQDYLLGRHAENCRVILFVEEAQGMPVETLEEIRMLSNLETSEEKLLQIVLFGQPELDDKLAGHAIRQLRERITHSFELSPFNREEIRDYVNARVRASGYRSGDLFSAATVRELERHSRGLLRRINVLADKALLAAFAAGDSAITPAHVRRAARDSAFAAAGSGARPWRWVALAVLLFAMVLAAWMLGSGRENVPQNAAAPVAAPVPVPESGAPRENVSGGRVSPVDAERAEAAVPPPAPSRAGELVDNRGGVPRLSAATGLVTTEHLELRLEPGAAAGPGMDAIPAEP